MSAGPAKAERRFRFNLRRSIYGWGGLGFVTLSVACLAFWCASPKSSNTDSDVLYMGGLFLSADNGVIRIRDDQWMPVKEMFDHFQAADDEIIAKELYPGKPLTLLVHRQFGLSLPGLHYGYVEYKTSIDSPIWMLSISPLIPFGVTTLLAAFCLHRYMATWRGLATAPKTSDCPDPLLSKLT